MLAPAPGWLVVRGAVGGAWDRGRARAALAGPRGGRPAAATAALVSTAIALRPPAEVPKQVDAVATVSETAHGSPFEAVIDGAPVLVFTDDDHPPLPIGSSVRITGRAEPAAERIRALVFADDLDPVGEPPPLLAAGDAARSSAARSERGTARRGRRAGLPASRWATPAGSPHPSTGR